MATYAQVSHGSSGNTVEELQRKLNEKGSYGLQEDGIFGAKTLAAVKDYQSKNSLQVDGIVGNNTWAKLLGSQTGSTATAPAANAAAPSVPDYSQWQYDPAANTAYQQQKAQADQAYSDMLALENPYDTYAPQLEEIYRQWTQRAPFSYDLGSDPMYQQYKDQYTHLGQLAMMDAMGQAAALTGGYGSSYGQSAGQQAYQSYLQQLNAMMPELYGMALDRYNAQTDAILNQYSMMNDMAQNAYSNYQNERSNAWQNVNHLYGLAGEAYDQGYNNWYNALQLGMNADSTAHAKQQQEREYLSGLISAGYTPTDAELAAAGMTRSQAQSLMDSHNGQNTSAATTRRTPSYNYDTHGYTKQDIEAMQTAAGITVDGIWGPDTEAAYQKGFTKESLKKIQNYVPDVCPEEEYLASYLFAYGPYSAYVLHTILIDPTLTAGEKDALAEKYGATENDYDWLESKGILPEL